MHSLVFAVPPTAPTNLALVNVTGNGNNRTVTLSWTDNSLKEARFTVQRATDANFTTGLTTFNYVNPSTVVPNTVTFQDTNATRDTRYWYRVYAMGRNVGDVQVYATSPIGFPTMSANSVSNTLQVNVGTPPALPTAPADPTTLTAPSPTGPPVSLTWTDNATNETGFVVERCTVVSPATTCGNFAQIAAPGPLTGTRHRDLRRYHGSRRQHLLLPGEGGERGRVVDLQQHHLSTGDCDSAAPTNFTVTNTPRNGSNTKANLSWSYGTNPTNFTIQRATNLSFTTGLNTSTAGPAPGLSRRP